MAIIGKIRKHSGLAVIIVGVAIAAFVIGDFGKKRTKGTNDIGVINGESIPYAEFNTKVDQAMEAQKENAGSDKISDQDAYQIRQTTWNNEVKTVLMGSEYDELGLTVSPEELFDQVQGKQPHRYILQYFKDPKTGQYDPALVLNYLKNLDKMEPKNRDMWLRFEKAIKDDRQETKFNNLISKGYYMPSAFLKKDYIKQTKSIKIRCIAPALTSIADSTVKVTDADFAKFYDKNKTYFYQDEPSRDLDYVTFEVIPSDPDRKKIAADVALLYKDFASSSDVVNFTNANSDKKADTVFLKKGTLPTKLDSLLFISSVGTLYQPFEFKNTWYMAKLLAIQERPDSMKGSQILIAFTSPGNEGIKRTKEQAKAKADSLLTALKKSPEKFAEVAKQVSDYPNAKDDGGDLKWFLDGNAGFYPFFKAGLEMKPKEMKVIETRIGYSLFILNEKTKPIKKVQAAVLTRAIEPSNQTYQDTYTKASSFAGQNKTPELFDKAITEKGLQKRTSPNLREMDNNLMGLPGAREVVRWAFAENTKVGEVSPVFDISGKYLIAVLKKIVQKGQQPLESIKDRIEPSVKNMKKATMIAEKMKQPIAASKEINTLATKLDTKVDTTVLTFSGFSRSAIGREMDLIGPIFTYKKGESVGPLTGNYGAYYLTVDEINEPPAKEDFTSEKTQQAQAFTQRVTSSLFKAIEKTAKITDNRLRFY
ncbi:MAG: SurA N-terminal domain-containing protein [Bacteroidales bacterium]|jgi:peptidyl-prolyl cis-trans isomerase D|nr:SurA N-terminal domain-containing protein [Bacteroidales bacterium]